MNHETFRRLRLFTAFLIIIASALLFGWFSQNATAQGTQIAEDVPSFRAYLPSIANTALPTATPQPWNWLTAMNAYRAMSQLPPVTEVPVWSDGIVKHARYMVETDIATHSEEPGNPWYTPEGAVAARYCNLLATEDINRSDQFALDAWMVAPFHAVSMLDPRLQRSAFGSYRAAGPGFTMAAGLDVLRGRDALPPQTVFPVLWPGRDAVVPFRMFWEETPSPFTSCPGYTAPSGLPIIVQLGTGDRTPRVTAHAFTRDGVALEHCVFDETTYTNPDAAMQRSGRSILDLRDAIVLIPRAPLDEWSKYSVSLTVDGQTYRWSFTVGATHPDTRGGGTDAAAQ